MTKNLISRQIIFDMKSEQRYAEIGRVYGVTKSEIEAVKFSARNDHELIFNMAYLMFESCVEKRGMDKNTAAGLITTSSLTAFILDTWVNQYAAERDTQRKIYNSYYKPKKDEELKFPGTHFSNPFMLRKEVIEEYKSASGEENYTLEANITRARNNWGTNVKASDKDLMRGIKVPDKIGAEEAFLLGIYYGDRVIKPSKYEIDLAGRREDKKLYEEIITPLLYLKFNLKREPTYPTGKKTPEKYGQLRIYINSKFHYTFLDNVFNFYENKKQGNLSDFLNLPLERIYIDEIVSEPFEIDENSENPELEFARFLQDYQEKIITYLNVHFFAGLIASKGNLGKEGLFFSKINSNFILNIGILAESIGYGPTLFSKSPSKNSDRVFFGKREIKKMTKDNRLNLDLANNGLFVNPLHLEFLS